MKNIAIPLDVLVQASHALDAVFRAPMTEPLPPQVRLDVAVACGRLRVYVDAILAAQKVEVTS